MCKRGGALKSVGKPVSVGGTGFFLWITVKFINDLQSVSERKEVYRNEVRKLTVELEAIL